MYLNVLLADGTQRSRVLVRPQSGVANTKSVEDAYHVTEIMQVHELGQLRTGDIPFHLLPITSHWPCRPT
jgi:hypothetical protein